MRSQRVHSLWTSLQVVLLLSEVIISSWHPRHARNMTAAARRMFIIRGVRVRACVSKSGRPLSIRRIRAAKDATVFFINTRRVLIPNRTILDFTRGSVTSTTRTQNTRPFDIRCQNERSRAHVVWIRTDNTPYGDTRRNNNAMIIVLCQHTARYFHKNLAKIVIFKMFLELQ